MYDEGARCDYEFLDVFHVRRGNTSIDVPDEKQLPLLPCTYTTIADNYRVADTLRDK